MTDNRQQRRKAEREALKRAGQHASQSRAEQDHGPIEETYRDKMNALANVLDELFNGPETDAPKETGFVLFVFPFEDAERPDRNRLNYISNANRADMATMFREMIARWEGRTAGAGTA
jgi:hypothetical protein